MICRREGRSRQLTMRREKTNRIPPPPTAGATPNIVRHTASRPPPATRFAAPSPPNGGARRSHPPSSELDDIHIPRKLGFQLIQRAILFLRYDHTKFVLRD